MNTSRAVVNRLLNPNNDSLTLNTLGPSNKCLGKVVKYIYYIDKRRLIFSFVTALGKNYNQSL